MNCASACDCGQLKSGPHDPDCAMYLRCNEGHMCDKHAAEAEADHAYLKHIPRHQVIDDEQSREEYAQELRDAGRSHLLVPS